MLTLLVEVNLAKFEAIEFEWDEGNLIEIEGHSVDYWECEECFFNEHKVYRNKRSGRPYRTYRLIGRTDAGRRLNVIFFIHSRRRVEAATTALVRVITAWSL